MGSNVFLTPNFMNQIGKLPGNPGKRISDISIRRSYSEVDTIVYNLPESFGISSLPEPETLETDFASYHYKIEQQGNKLMYTRYFELKKENIPRNVSTNYTILQNSFRKLTISVLSLRHSNNLVSESCK